MDRIIDLRTRVVNKKAYTCMIKKQGKWITVNYDYSVLPINLNITDADYLALVTDANYLAYSWFETAENIILDIKVRSQMSI